MSCLPIEMEWHPPPHRDDTERDRLLRPGVVCGSSGGAVISEKLHSLAGDFQAVLFDKSPPPPEKNRKKLNKNNNNNNNNIIYHIYTIFYQYN